MPIMIFSRVYFFLVHPLVFFYDFQAEFTTPVPVQGLFGVVNVAKAFQEKLRMKNLNKDSEDVKEGDLEKRKIKSVLGGSRGTYFFSLHN